MFHWKETDIWLFTPEEFEKLPDGIELVSVVGNKVVKGKDYIDMDTRFGHLAFGVKDPLNHPEKELFMILQLIRR